ncbi:putative cupin domain-containing protein [Erysiphe neolycopersici]|uniref:CENP-C homolog n=1 Tax=Erysiphe neolycopersici TaxID=212602 RepID=A0A420H947_9PEZI|nr:putative cupin domain-containing protein [Erysiphe neolycopersici]
MSHEDSKPIRRVKDNQFPFNVGVKGRKTGLTLPELGERDENGLEPMDHLFSSPEEPNLKKLSGKKNDATLSDEEDMELGESSTPGPIEALAERKRLISRLPPPRSRSPIKTFLQSPARRNATISAISSPLRGSMVEPKSISRPGSVQRKLEFSRTTSDSRRNRLNTIKSKPKTHPSEYRSAKITNGLYVNRARATEESSDEEVDDISFVDRNNTTRAESEQHDEDESSGNESDRIIEYDNQSTRAEEKVKDTTLRKPPQPKEWRPKFVEARSVTKDIEADIQESNSKLNSTHNNIRGPTSEQNPSFFTKAVLDQKLSEEDKHSYKHPQNSSGDASSSGSEVEGRDVQVIKDISNPKNKVSKVRDPKPTSVQPASSLSRGKTRPKEKNSGSRIAKVNAQPGPQLPKSRGLVILRREDDKILQTRSGRNSIRPLAFWSNEKIEFEDEEPTIKNLTADFAGRKIKHVVRAEEIVEPVKRSRTKTHSSKDKKRKRTRVSDDEEEEEKYLEPWEVNPGRIVAEVRTWDQEDKSGSQIGEREEEIALSSSAIVTRDIANASFRFAKTLTLPFFGAGMVDLPPGSEKKQKNSRKMQMAFFVFYGKVQVTVNDNVFRISKGGMWQVPRGNFYGIQNDYDKPARIFFSQGCEIEEEVTES